MYISNDDYLDNGTRDGFTCRMLCFYLQTAAFHCLWSGPRHMLVFSKLHLCSRKQVFKIKLVLWIKCSLACSVPEGQTFLIFPKFPELQSLATDVQKGFQLEEPGISERLDTGERVTTLHTKDLIPKPLLHVHGKYWRHISIIVWKQSFVSSTDILNFNLEKTSLLNEFLSTSASLAVSVGTTVTG